MTEDKKKELHKKLEKILESGDEQAISTFDMLLTGALIKMTADRQAEGGAAL